MKNDRYIVFKDIDLAQKFIEELDEQLGEHWADPIIHPFDGRVLIPWNNDYLSDVSDLLQGKATIEPEDARKKGWNFGYHKGKFAKASAKLEDALFGRDALELFNEYPNFPAFKSVFLGILTALYGVKESLRNTSELLGDDAIAWWELKFDEIKADPVLWMFYDMHNSDKHSLEDSQLHPRTKFFGYQGPPPNAISGEGVFCIIDHGTVDERRVFIPGAKAKFECYLATSSGISDESAKDLLDQTIRHYKKLVWDAKQKFGD